MNPYSDFGVKARGIMLKKRITQTEIARRLGVSVSYVGDVLRGSREGNKCREGIKKILEMVDEE